MVKKSRKFLAVLLALSMVFSMLSLPAFAAAEENDVSDSGVVEQQPGGGKPEENAEENANENENSGGGADEPGDEPGGEEENGNTGGEKKDEGGEPGGGEKDEGDGVIVDEKEPDEIPAPSDEPNKVPDSVTPEQVQVPYVTPSNDGGEGPDDEPSPISGEGGDSVACSIPWLKQEAEEWIRNTISESGDKFLAVMASKPAADAEPTKVIARVDADYKATLTIPGTEVSPGNVTIGVGMNNVSSLGVDGIRAHAMEIPTGVTAPQTVELSSLFNVLNFDLKGSITANIKNDDGERKTVTYTIETVENRDANDSVTDYTITGTPYSSDDASAAWHHMMENFSAETQGDDSSFTIKNGSWLQIGNQVLCFEDGYAGDLTLDNILGGDTQGDIRGAVRLKSADDNKVAFCLKAGTRLAVSSSAATLDKDMTVEIKGLQDDALSGVLEDLRDANSTGGLIKTLVMGVMRTFLNAVNGKNITVDIQFGEPKADVEDNTPYKFKVEVSSVLEDKTTTTVTGTVDENYIAKLVLPNKAVNAGNVTIGVTMTNVGSLGINGTKSHEMTINTNVKGIQHNLFEALKILEATALADFQGATIQATIKSDGDEKAVRYTLAGSGLAWTEGEGYTGEAKVITGTPNDIEDARAAWALMVNQNNFDVGTQNPDSKIIIANGSSLQIGNEVLCFEDNYEGDLILDNIASMPVEKITDAVKLKDAEAPALTFTLKKGTTLAVSSSYATLKKDVVVTVTGISNSELDALDVLSTLQAAVNSGNMDAVGLIKGLIGMMDTAIQLIDKAPGNIGVEIEFLCEHEYDEPVWNWNGYSSAEATFACKHCGDTQTVQAAITNNGGSPTRTHTATVVFKERTYTDTRTQTISTGGSGGGGGGGTYIPPSTPSNPSNPSSPGDIEIEDPDTPLGQKPFLFADVTETAWFYEDVKKAFNWDLMDGVASTRFNPYGESTRGMIAQVLYRLSGEPGIEDYNIHIPDLKDTDWFHDAAVWAYATGVYTGYSDQTFRGGKMITREELAAVLYRFAKMNGCDVSSFDDLSAFQDKNEVSGWALEGTQWTVGAGLIRGRSNTMLVPRDGTIRAELAAVLVRFVEKYMPELAGPTVA